jgi:chloramphenicol O-acetyltransferase type A
MKRLIEIDNWSRKEHYLFFKGFTEPFFGVTVHIDVTQAYATCQQQGYSFFLYYLHKALVAANSIANFKYRIIDDVLYEFDEVHASPTINRENGSFGFGYFTYYPSFLEFAEHAKKEIERVRSTNTLLPSTGADNVLHCSSVPWLQFTSVSHARPFQVPDSCPKITFGKMFESDGRQLMPLAVHGHHALMDGWHVAQFIDTMQAELDK